MLDTRGYGCRYSFLTRDQVNAMELRRLGRGGVSYANQMREFIAIRVGLHCIADDRNAPGGQFTPGLRAHQSTNLMAAA
jgi:hypothetical protein